MSNQVPLQRLEDKKLVLESTITLCRDFVGLVGRFAKMVHDARHMPELDEFTFIDMKTWDEIYIDIGKVGWALYSKAVIVLALVRDYEHDELEDLKSQHKELKEFLLAPQSSHILSADVDRTVLAFARNLSQLASILLVSIDTVLSLHVIDVPGKSYCNEAQRQKLLEAKGAAPVNDGPIPPKHFKWGDITEKTEPKPWELLNFVWSQGRRVAKDVVLEKVWGAGATNGCFDVAKSKVNALLTKCECPLAMSVDGGDVYIA